MSNTSSLQSILAADRGGHGTARPGREDDDTHPRRDPRSEVACAVVVSVILSSPGNDDGPRAFVGADNTSALAVEWTRVGDDLSGSLSAMEVTHAQKHTAIFSTAPSPGEIQQQSAPFTGSLRDDSVQLLRGSLTPDNRVNGRLAGDTRELTISRHQAVLARRRKRAGDGDAERRSPVSRRASVEERKS